MLFTYRKSIAAPHCTPAAVSRAATSASRTDAAVRTSLREASRRQHVLPRNLARPVNSAPTRCLGALAVFSTVLFVSPAAVAQESGAWRYSASVYLYLPSVDGKTSFPVDTGGTRFDVSGDKILDSLKMVFMGSLEANNGRWGVFTDAIYLDLGNTKTASRDFTIGNVEVPASTTADLRLDLKGWVWTLAGEYRLLSDAALTADLVGGARMLDLKQTLGWNISGNLGPINPGARSGTSEVKQTVWDAIIGVKGRYAFGDQRRWKVPFYVDVGAGESKVTWQAATGIGYAFNWGELSALYRVIDYDIRSDKNIQSIRFSGPMVAATFRW